MTVPEWIKRRQAQGAKEKLLQVKQDGPEFWESLVDHLRLNTEALPLLHAHGRVTPFSTPTGELTCRVQILQRDGAASTAYTDVFYTPGGSIIWSRALGKRSVTYCMGIFNGELAVVPDDGDFIPKSAKEVAERLVESTLDQALLLA